MTTRKEAYQEKIDAKLKKWRAEIDKLKADSREAKADAKLEYQHQIDELSSKQKAAEQRFNELKRAGADSWEDMKTGIDKALNALQQSFERASQRVRKVGEKSKV